MFQFYLSSIKSVRHVGTPQLLECFNSTLVQLKADNGRDEKYLKNRFNSTLVQLKVKIWNFMEAIGNMFQFYFKINDLSSIYSHFLQTFAVDLQFLNLP